MKLNRIEVLEKNEIQQIHETTLELLESVGVKVESEEARNFLEENGAIVNDLNQKDFIKFPKELVLEQLKNVPDSFSLWGPDGSYQVEINTSKVNFSTFGAAMRMYDPSKKSRTRKSLLKDAINHIRVVNGLNNIISSHVDVWPNDVPFTELHCHTLREWAKHSYKPYGMACYGRTATQDMLNIASIVVGGKEELIKRPRLLGVFNPTSPLRLPQILLNGLFIFAKYKQPINITSAASAGSTAPVTLAGLLTQTNMEILSAIVLTQLISPGTPVLYGSTNTIMDPPSGNMAYGSIEFGLITVAAAQLAHFYNIPSKGSGALTDSKCFDLQNGFERFMTLSFAANAGHNYITCAGTYESSISEALELLVIDDEMAGMIKRGIEGIEVNTDTIASEEIIKIATTEGNYLGTKHSVKNTRKEIFVPKIVNRERRSRWRREGSKDMMTIAREKVEEILKSQQGPGLSPDIEAELTRYTKMVASRSLDDYRRLEGMDDSKGPVEISGFKIE